MQDDTDEAAFWGIRSASDEWWCPLNEVFKPLPDDDDDEVISGMTYDGADNELPKALEADRSAEIAWREDLEDEEEERVKAYNSQP